MKQLFEALAWVKQPGGPVSKLMAKRCDLCPACRYARANPESLFGQLVQVHGRFCPFWQAWQREHGAGANERA